LPKSITVVVAEAVVIKTKATIRALVVIVEAEAAIIVEAEAAIIVEAEAAIIVEAEAAIIVEAEEQHLQREVAAAVVILVIPHLPRLRQTKKPVLMAQNPMLMVNVLQQQ
jgi:hypothetical protein